MHFPLILFDCDGTLVNSELLNLKAIIETIHAYGATGYDMDHGMHHFSGHRFSQILSLVSAETGITFPEDAKHTFLKKVRDLAPTEMTRVEGAMALVEVANQKAQIYVVSNGERTNVITALEFTGLKSFFSDDHIITGAMAENPKPAPDLFLLACSHAGIEASQSLIIEDSVAGVRGGKAAGATVWGFTGTHHDPHNHAQKLLAAGADKVFSSMDEMRKFLQELKKQKMPSI